MDDQDTEQLHGHAARPHVWKRLKTMALSPWTWVPPQYQRWLKLLGYFLLVNSIMCVLFTVLPVKEFSLLVMQWIQVHPLEGALLLPVMFCLTIPFNIPSTMLEILAGSVFGMTYGVTISVIGKTSGTVIAFKLGKRLGKARIGNYLETHFPSFTAMSSVLESKSWKPLLLIQLSSLPHVVKCYGLAITEVTTYRFTITSLLGGLPNAIMWAYIGYETKDILSDKADGAAMTSSRLALLIGGAIFTVLAMVFLVIYTRQQLQVELMKLKQQLSDNEGADADNEMELECGEEDDVLLARAASESPLTKHRSVSISIEK